MKLPFTIHQFFEVFGEYNLEVWPAQVFLVALALAIILLLIRPHRNSNRWIAGALAFLWMWMALAYHFAFFSQINPAAGLFGAAFLLLAAQFVWHGVIRDHLQFRGTSNTRKWIGGAIVAYALVVYPVLTFISGHRYPEAPTFGLPCPTTIFTLGVLLFAQSPTPRSLFVVPLLWAVIGSIATFQLRVFADVGLLIAGITTVVVLLKRNELGAHLGSMAA